MENIGAKRELEDSYAEENKKKCFREEQMTEGIIQILNKNDDSIFSKINLPIQKKKKEVEGLDIFLANEDLDYFYREEKSNLSNFQKQSTQKFFDDLNSAMVIPTTVDCTNILDHSKLFCDSQYQRRENEILNDPEIVWDTEIFLEEMFPINSKGPFYDLPLRVKDLIREHKGIDKLYDWQHECLNLRAIKSRKNLIYALPTSGGKTLVSEILMLREIICREQNVIFVLPYVSIVQEKFSAMTPFALTLNFNVEEYAGGKGKCPPSKRYKRKTIYICSIEKAAILFNSLIETNRDNEVGLVVIDELHLVGERGRGSILENFLIKVMASNRGIQIIGMSATIGNISELSHFLNADIYTRGFRPVELKEFIKCGNDILAINPHGTSPHELFKFSRSVDFKYSPSVQRADPDHLTGLVSEVIPTQSCLIFCPTRKNCENVAVLLTKILSKKKYLEYRQAEKAILIDAMEKLCGSVNPILAQTIPFGIAFHHSGLLSDERKLLEIAYRVGTLSVICCTSTLAAGVNLPAKRVIIRAPYVGNKFMSLSQYKQMIGRAGRAGLGETGESILIFQSKDNFQVGQMLSSPMDNVTSAMLDNNFIGLENLILSAIGLKIADSLEELLKLVSKSLLEVQKEQLRVDITKQVSNIIKLMFKKKVLKLIDAKINRDLKNHSSVITTQEINNTHSTTNMNSYNDNNIKTKFILSRLTKFELSTLGHAAYKAGISYEKAQSINLELKFALRSLVLTDYSHLLYLILSLGNDTIINADPNILFREYNSLKGGPKDLVKIIGITDVYIIKMYKNMSLKGPVESQLTRFYVILIINDIINLTPLHEVANKFVVEQGVIQNLLNQTSASANTLIRFCEMIEEFWCFRPLLQKLNEKLDRCTTFELEPLMELPSVKSARARQLYTAGFRSIEDIAKCKPQTLARKIEHLNMKTAKEIISAAKLILLRRLEDIEEETNSILECLK